MLTACSSLLYALRVLRGHGLPELSAKDVFQATVFSETTYCLPAWFGFCILLQPIAIASTVPASLCQARPLVSQWHAIHMRHYCGHRGHSFNKILRCGYNILQSYLSDRPEILYNLRKRKYNKSVIHKTVDWNDRDFLVRNLYENLLTESLAQPSMYFYVLCFALLYALLFVFLTDCLLVR